jgi:hypothetical protein
VEALSDFIRFELRVGVRNDQFGLAGELIVPGILRLFQEDEFAVF